jgi:hypothetical protein
MTKQWLILFVSEALKILCWNRDADAFQSRRFPEVTSGMESAPPPNLAQDFQVPSRVMLCA